MNKKLVSIVLSLLALYLLVSFIASIVLSAVSSNNKVIDSEVVVKHASRFMEDPNLIQLGKKLDCSGFTRRVYADLGASIPVNAVGQFSLRTESDTIAVYGDLVFFSIHSSQVNHVGILVNDSIFIHSPGRNREVQLESLKSSYWRKFYTGSVKVK